nr:DNA helicase Pif1-like protein [Tanacetum cinerariifolium]
MSDEYNEPLTHIFEFFENRCIHEGRVVFLDFNDLVYVRSMFSHIEFDFLLEINEQIVPCFILEFYSQYRINYDLEGQMFVEFVIENQLFFISLEEFGQILGIPYKGDRSFSDKWSLDDLPFSVLTDGPYQTNPRSPDDIKLLERKTRKDYGMRRGRSSTSSLSAFGQSSSSHPNDDDNDGNDEGTSCASTLSLTRFVNSLTNEVPRVFLNPPNIDPNMEPFYTRQTKIINHQVQLRDEQRGGIRSIEKGIKNLLREKKKKQLFVNISSDEDNTTTPSSITKSSSSSPPNAPSKTPSTKDTSSTFGTTSSLFESKPQSSPSSSNDTPYPQPSNPFRNDIMNATQIPLNPIQLQSHPSLDITLSLSPITPLDHFLDTPSPPSPQPQPPPQPPLTGHPIYFNYHDYHGSTCLCCFHNQNFFFTLRNEMNLMFAHLEYLLTSAIASLSPPHP